MIDFVAHKPQLHVKYPFTLSHGNDNERERRGVGMATRRDGGDSVCPPAWEESDAVVR